MGRPTDFSCVIRQKCQRYAQGRCEAARDAGVTPCGVRAPAPAAAPANGLAAGADVLPCDPECQGGG